MINICNKHYNNLPQIIKNKPTLNSKEQKSNAVENLSFRGSAEPVAKVAKETATLMDKIFCGGVSRWIYKTALDNRTLLDASIATTIAMTLRPLAIMVTPGQKKEDIKYSVAKSFATAFLGLASAVIVFSNVGKVTKAIANSESAKQMFNDGKVITNLTSWLGPAGQKLGKDKVLANTEVAKGFIEQNLSLVKKHFKSVLTGMKTAEQIKDTIKPKMILDMLKDDKEFAKAVVTETVNKRIETYNNILNLTMKYISAIPEAFFLYKLVPPIINKIFPKKTNATEIKNAQPVINHKLVNVYNNNEGGKA